MGDNELLLWLAAGGQGGGPLPDEAFAGKVVELLAAIRDKSRARPADQGQDRPDHG